MGTRRSSLSEMRFASEAVFAHSLNLFTKFLNV